MYEAPILAEAEVAGVLKPGLYELRLPNGKITLGHLSKELQKSAVSLEVGATVTAELTPFDFDSARISSVSGS